MPKLKKQSADQIRKNNTNFKRQRLEEETDGQARERQLKDAERKSLQR